MSETNESNLRAIAEADYFRTLDEVYPKQERLAFANLENHHPMPFYLEQSNDKAIEVRDLRGDIVFRYDFAGIELLMPETQEEIKQGAVATANFLLVLSGSTL